MSKKVLYNLTQNIKVTDDTASYTYEDKIEKLKVNLALNWKDTLEDIEGIFNEVENKKEGGTKLNIPISIDWKHKE